MIARMKKSRLIMIIFGVCVLMLVGSQSAPAEDLDIVNRPVNIDGLTGIVYTTAPYTVPKNTFEIGISVVSESSITPDYTILQYPLIITRGISEHSEISLRATYYNIKEGPTITATTDRKAGTVEMSYKWNFIPPIEDSARPAVALIVSGIVPQERNNDIRINAVSHWGMRIGLSVGTELTWRDHLLAVYADGQVVGQDMTEKRLRDIYEIVNAGLLFPISRYRNLQLLLEYSMVHGKDTITIDGGDFTALTYGLRMVGEKFNFTMGTQFVKKKTEGFENSNKVVGMISVKY
jgi:hypothetical protein